MVVGATGLSFEVFGKTLSTRYESGPFYMEATETKLRPP